MMTWPTFIKKNNLYCWDIFPEIIISLTVPFSGKMQVVSGNMVRKLVKIVRINNEI